MFDHLLTDEHRRVRDEAREFVKTTPRELILDMDAERVHFPKEWLREAAHRRLLGVRHPVRWGGRGLDWVAAPPAFAFSNGVHICEVGIDADTGETQIVGYWAVDDVGTVINPMIVEGQIHGGVAQGLGQNRICGNCLSHRLRVPHSIARPSAVGHLLNCYVVELERKGTVTAARMVSFSKGLTSLI